MKNEYDLQAKMLRKQIEQYNALIKERNFLKKYKIKEVNILSRKYHDDSLL